MERERERREHKEDREKFYLFFLLSLIKNLNMIMINFPTTISLESFLLSGKTVKSQ